MQYFILDQGFMLPTVSQLVPPHSNPFRYAVSGVLSLTG